MSEVKDTVKNGAKNDQDAPGYILGTDASTDTKKKRGRPRGVKNAPKAVQENKAEFDTLGTSPTRRARGKQVKADVAVQADAEQATTKTRKRKINTNADKAVADSAGGKTVKKSESVKKPEPAKKPVPKYSVDVPAEYKEKLYGQFLNKLLMLLLAGFAAGACLLAALDYLLNQQIPERHPIFIGLVAVSSLICLIYWAGTFKRAKGIPNLRGLSLFALIIAIIGTSAGTFGSYRNINNYMTYFQGEIIQIRQQKEVASVLQEYLRVWRTTPNYCITYIGDDMHYATVYNAQGESITQLIFEDNRNYITHVAVTLNDGTAVIVGDDFIERRLDTDNLGYIMEALQWVIDGKDGVTLERYSVAADVIDRTQLPPDAFPGTEYTVKISGYSALIEFYAGIIGEQAARDTLAGFRGIEDVAIIYSIQLEYGYIGAGSFMQANGEGGVLWFIDGYTEVYDWSLGGERDWYTYSFDDTEVNERMIEAAMLNVTSMLNQFGVDASVNFGIPDDVDTDDIDDSDFYDPWAPPDDIDDEQGINIDDIVEPIEGRVFTLESAQVILYDDLTFEAVLFRGEHFNGTYTEVENDDGFDIIFEVLYSDTVDVGDGYTAEGSLRNNGSILLIPEEWDADELYGYEFFLR